MVDRTLNNLNVPVKIRGVATIAHVESYRKVKPWPWGPHYAPSELDARGYEEVEWNLPEVFLKLTDEERSDIEAQIFVYIDETFGEPPEEPST